jgi:hypothetical protein
MKSQIGRFALSHVSKARHGAPGFVLSQRRALTQTMLLIPWRAVVFVAVGDFG